MTPTTGGWRSINEVEGSWREESEGREGLEVRRHAQCKYNCTNYKKEEIFHHKVDKKIM